ncbi:MAG: hypothetical protein ACREIB_07445, partial [Pseudomonadota bacterium]
MGPVTSESKYSEAVEVALGRSRLASLSIAAAGGATLGMLLATPMPWWAHGALSVAVGASVVGALRSVAHCKG